MKHYTLTTRYKFADILSIEVNDFNSIEEAIEHVNNVRNTQNDDYAEDCRHITLNDILEIMQ